MSTKLSGRRGSPGKPPRHGAVGLWQVEGQGSGVASDEGESVWLTRSAKNDSGPAFWSFLGGSSTGWLRKLQEYTDSRE